MTKTPRLGAFGEGPQSKGEHDRWLGQILLQDSEGNPSTIVAVWGSEAGLDHLQVVTQSGREYEQGIATCHRITSSEIPCAPDMSDVRARPL